MTTLVMGASGFLGSHVTRQLVGAGHDVRVMLRRSSATAGIDDLEVQRVYGDLFDHDALRAAMRGCDTIHYCVVDARMWLRDPTPLFRTNVDGLRNVLDAAADAGVAKFVFTSTVGTMAASTDRSPVDETQPHNWDDGGAYIEARVQAEKLVLSYARDRGLPAVAVCPSTTYGPRDHQPTPHGSMVQRIALGKMPVYLDMSLEVVGIEDAARAMLLAADRGRVGERYIVSDRMMTNRDVATIAAEAVGLRPPRLGIPIAVLRAGARVNDAAARLLRRDLPFAYVGIRMAEVMPPLDHSKAERELGWKPHPVEESIAQAARWFREQATGDGGRD
jgi:nucleoside-diphosphate-sugar epimerase